MISVNVKLFAMAKDLAGMGETTLSLEEGALASSVVDHFVKLNPRFSAWKDHIRLAVNSEYADVSHPLHDGDEVAIIPPVSGG
jgi:molybdopterin synthase sulfur carrier subunit